MDQFIKSNRYIKPKKQAGKTIALSGCFLLSMALLMSFGGTSFQAMDDVSNPNTIAKSTSINHKS